MNEKLLFNGFIIATLSYAIIYIFVLIVLKKEGFGYSILNIDLSNYSNLRKLVKAKRKYKWLYLAYLITTFLPLLITGLLLMFLLLDTI